MYEIFEHTADLGIRVRAAALDQLFVDAARGLFSIVASNLDAAVPRETVEIHLEADDLEQLLHDWLSELLYIFHTRRLVLIDFAVHVVATRLTAAAGGEPIDVERHGIDVEVKAVTWHGLKVERDGDRWLAEVIIDV